MKERLDYLEKLSIRLIQLDMPIIQQKNNKGGLSVKAYVGDAKTLLAFNLPKSATTDLAGFTIQYTTDDGQSGYIYNDLQFENPSQHAQDTTQPVTSSINSPIHKFRWVHVPAGAYKKSATFTYTVTPRYFDKNNSLEPIDTSVAVSIKVPVGPFATKNLELGFTRGFTQSQAFVRHFTIKAPIQPKKGSDLIFSTSQVAGKDATGKNYTFADEYEWLGFTARTKIFELLNNVLSDSSLQLSMFAYDLNEPDILNILLKLAAQGRIRLILDNATLHHNSKMSTPEDKFEKLFRSKAKRGADILRGHFGRYAHDKVLIVSKGQKPSKVLTGSTNFSITGMYVNSNHILIFDDGDVAATYQEVFDLAWNAQMWGGKTSKAFNKTAPAGKSFDFSTALPNTSINFSPHTNDYAEKLLADMAARITQEGKQTNGSVLFAVMGLAQGTGPVLPTLENVHEEQNIFSYGISDQPAGIFLYTPGKKTGVLVTGKPTATQLPPPFNQVPNIGGIKHQVHHKFVVCGFNGNDPVVYCGSSNLALGGEESNGDNLLAIHDEDVAVVFAIEALALVDHFDFLDRCATKAKASTTAKTALGKRRAKIATIQNGSKDDKATSVHWYLSANDKWTAAYYDTDDLKCVDRQLFG
jgi:hypothetical protein